MVRVMQPQTFHFLLTGEGVPEWVRLMPMGMFRPTDPADKRGPWKLTDPAAVIAASTLPLVIDENHTTLAGAVSAPARGWIVTLEARDDGLYGRIEWTTSGHALMADKAYRGFSPTFLANAAGTVTRLTGAAITNNPALTELNILTNHQETRMDLVQLRAALGLPETADEAAIMARITANAAAAVSQTQQLTAIAQAVGLPADTTAERLVVTLTAQREGANQVQTLITQVASLEQQLSAASAATAKDKAVAFVAKAIADGKPIVALQERLTAMHIADPVGTEALVNAMASINSGGMPQRPAGGGGGEALTAAEENIVSMMGIDRTAYIAERARNEAALAARRG